MSVGCSVQDGEAEAPRIELSNILIVSEDSDVSGPEIIFAVAFA
jgi:hypothetical protein